jgi:hypothetical protein
MPVTPKLQQNLEDLDIHSLRVRDLYIRQHRLGFPVLWYLRVYLKVQMCIRNKATVMTGFKFWGHSAQSRNHPLAEG